MKNLHLRNTKWLCQTGLLTLGNAGGI